MYQGILIAAGTATTNPDPNSLSVTNPYDPTTNNYADRWTPAPEWTTQASTYCKALISNDIRDGRGVKPLTLAFVPADGAAITYTVKIWEYVKVANTWVNPQSNGSLSFTGFQSTLIENPGTAPIFIEIDAISAGELGIYFDNGAAGLL